MVRGDMHRTEIPLEPPGGLDERFCEVMDAAPVMIWVSGQDKLCTWFNAPWLAFTGRPMAHERGNGWAEGVHPDDFDRCLEIYVRHFDARQQFRMQYRLRRHDGEYRWIDDIGIPRHARNGSFLGYIGSCTDVNDQREMQEVLKEARGQMFQLQKMEAIGQLTGGIAHDFNNLLMVVIGNLEIAERNIETAGSSLTRQKRAIQSAMQGAKRAAALTQRLLAFSRRQPLNPRVLDLNTFINGEIEFLQRTLGETVEVRTLCGIGLWQVEADMNQLQAALLNLAVNARDAMPEGGKLAIETSNVYLDSEYCSLNPEVHPGEYVLMSVTDTGAGMPSEVIGRAFEPFFSTKPVGQGTGLGLSQVYGFIKQSGGLVKISSQVGTGTAVKIYLPRYCGEVSVSQDTDMPAIALGVRGETILIVEDDKDVRSYLITIVRGLKYRVLHAPDAIAALGFLEQSDLRIDLLLTDVVLPGMNGRELATRAQRVRPNIKMLFMSGYPRDVIVHQGRLDADVEMIQKPVTQDQLAARIRTLLDRMKRPKSDGVGVADGVTGGSSSPCWDRPGSH